MRTFGLFMRGRKVFASGLCRSCGAGFSDRTVAEAGDVNDDDEPPIILYEFLIL